jgi:hypothetical protein
MPTAVASSRTVTNYGITMKHVISRLKDQCTAVPVLHSKPLPYAAAFLVVVLVTFYWRVSSNVPLLNAKGFFEFSDKRAKTAFIGNARQMLHDWFEKNPNKPVSVYSDTGTVIVLPGRMANEIRNDKRFHLRQHVERVCKSFVPTQSLSNIIKDDAWSPTGL